MIFPANYADMVEPRLTLLLGSHYVPYISCTVLVRRHLSWIFISLHSTGVQVCDKTCLTCPRRCHIGPTRYGPSQKLRDGAQVTDTSYRKRLDTAEELLRLLRRPASGGAALLPWNCMPKMQGRSIRQDETYTAIWATTCTHVLTHQPLELS